MGFMHYMGVRARGLTVVCIVYGARVLARVLRTL